LAGVNILARGPDVIRKFDPALNTSIAASAASYTLLATAANPMDRPRLAQAACDPRD
jgi:hypothetical protein